MEAAHRGVEGGAPIGVFCKEEKVLRGGNVYDRYLLEYLRRRGLGEAILIRGCAQGPCRRLRYFLKCHGVRGERRLYIEDPRSLAANYGQRSRPAILLVHNLPGSRLQDRTFGRFLTWRMRSHLRRVAAIVVESHWYRDIFRHWYAGDIRVIHSPFNLETYNLAPFDAAAFRARLGLDARPIIYLGPRRREKGVVETARSLRQLKGVQLVTSGGGDVDAPTIHLALGFEDYLRLLSLATVTVLLSREAEGWPRVAHESLLMGTPVIGNRAGGLGELLEGGAQALCESPGDLPGLVQKTVFAGRRAAPESVAWSRSFDVERFESAWGRLFSDLGVG